MTDSSPALTAKRFAGKPMTQPLYHFSSVEKCQRDLSGSSIQLVENRENFVDHLSELVLLCNAAVQRAGQRGGTGKITSKPLSLEYIADRLDVDDPLWGYMVRDPYFRLQGFITCTTFTNWQTTFRWDSIHDSAFAYDDDQLAQQMAEGIRKYDRDGSLAAELQSTVRCGDPWNEGIVWPRIAEISLLGGLGCGKALVELVIEKLEGMKATATQNFDYVVLQATENAVPFYESMGFIRVGCITKDDSFNDKKMDTPTSSGISGCDDNSEPTIVAVPVEPSSATNALVSPPEIVSSAVLTYEVTRAGETVAEIARKVDVNAFDIVFLNHCIYKDITQRSYLFKGTKLFIPSDKVKRDAISLASQTTDLSQDSDAPRWYIANENDTPRMISKMFQVNCSELVKANRERLPELMAISRLKDGTRIKISHFHIHDDQHVPYCHWTFPDDSFEQNDPSYMMARPLNRRSGAKANKKAVEQSLATPITKYVRPPDALYSKVIVPASAKASTEKIKNTLTKAPGMPQKPKRPLSAFTFYSNEYRPKVMIAGQSGAEASKLLAANWKGLTKQEKAPYERLQEKEGLKYQIALAKYKEDLKAFYQSHPELSPSDGENGCPSINTMCNKVVTIKAESIPETHRQFEYFYVLTFIPDLHWCHLVPMRKAGVWGDEAPKAKGRPIWMLVDESMGMEVDISASCCTPVLSKAMKRTVDADEEQWDIPTVVNVGQGNVVDVTSENEKITNLIPFAAIFTNRVNPGLVGNAQKDVSIKRPRKLQGLSATKPLTGTVERKRKRSSSVDTRKATKLESTKEPEMKSVTSTCPEKTLRGVYRDLPHRKAAPVSFSDSSPSTTQRRYQSPAKPKKVSLARKLNLSGKKSTPTRMVKARENLSIPAVDDLPKPRGRELLHRRAAPTSFEDASPSPKVKKPRKSLPSETLKAVSLFQRNSKESPRIRGVVRAPSSHRAASTSFSSSSPPKTIKSPVRISPFSSRNI